MKYILFAILIYLAYQFIFNLLIPVIQTTQKLKKGVQEMKGQMEEQMKKEQGFNSENISKKAPPQKSSEDYIDFEEVK